jgi:hypothetical protein
LFLFCIEDGRRVVDRPITSGYRNDAMRIAARGVSICRGPIHLPQATGLTLLEQDFESALAAIPSGYGEGVYEGLRYGVVRTVAALFPAAMETIRTCHWKISSRAAINGDH